MEAEGWGGDCCRFCVNICSVVCSKKSIHFLLRYMYEAIKMNSPGGYRCIIYSHQYQVGALQDFIAILYQLFDVTIGHYNRLRNCKCPSLGVLWPIPGFPVFFEEFKCNTF